MKQAGEGVFEPVVETTTPAPLVDEMQHQNEITSPILSSAEGSMLHEVVTSANVDTVTAPTITSRQLVAGKDLSKLADSGAGILSDVSESEFSFSDEEIGDIAFEYSNDQLMWPTNPPLPEAVVESSPAGQPPTAYQTLIVLTSTFYLKRISRSW